MAQFPYRIDLSQTDFPLLTQELGRSVLVSSFKNSPTGEKDNSPQIYYSHNVIPTDRGLVSVGYEEVIPAVEGAEANNTFDDVRIIFGNAGNRVHLGITVDRHAFVLEQGDTIWTHGGHPSVAPGTIITTGTVNGITYIHVKDAGTFIFNETTKVFDSVTFTGMPISNMIGISASSGYLIAFNEFEFAWSSTIDPTDFTPSATTGAGYGNVAGIDGVMIFIVPNSLGLLAYTEANVVALTYTGNKKYPFKARLVDNSKGAMSLDHIAYEANAADHFAHTKGGMQTVNSRLTTNILPEVTDFLSGKELEDFDEATSTFSITELTTTMKKKIKLIASRYLIISYGITSFTHALIYDISLKKLGKVKITHTDCFEYLSNQLELPKESIAFLKSDGAIEIMKSSVPTSGRVGVLLIGKFQYSRDRMLDIHNVTVENIKTTDSFTFTDLVSLDGRNISSSVSGTEISGTGYRSYNLRASGLNHSLLFVGSFNFSTIQCVFSQGGKVRYS